MVCINIMTIALWKPFWSKGIRGHGGRLVKDNIWNSWAHPWSQAQITERTHMLHSGRTALKEEIVQMFSRCLTLTLPLPLEIYLPIDRPYKTVVNWGLIIRCRTIPNFPSKTDTKQRQISKVVVWCHHRKISCHPSKKEAFNNSWKIRRTVMRRKRCSNRLWRL